MTKHLHKNGTVQALPPGRVLAFCIACLLDHMGTTLSPAQAPSVSPLTSSSTTAEKADPSLTLRSQGERRKRALLELLGDGCDLLHAVLVGSQVTLKSLMFLEQGLDLRQGGCLIILLPQHGFFALGWVMGDGVGGRWGQDTTERVCSSHPTLKPQKLCLLGYFPWRCSLYTNLQCRRIDVQQRISNYGWEGDWEDHSPLGSTSRTFKLVVYEGYAGICRKA